MRILALLWTVCLVKLCNCEDDGKVDGSLFNVEEAEEDGVKILKLTARDGASKLTYGEDTIWPGKKDVMCLSALLYIDGEKPTLALLVTRDKKNKQGTVYRYHDGKKWKSITQENFFNKLAGMRKSVSSPNPSSHPSQ